MNIYNGLVNQKFKKSGGGVFSPPRIMFVNGCNTEFLTDLIDIYIPTDTASIYILCIRIWFYTLDLSAYYLNTATYLNLNLILNILF